MAGLRQVVNEVARAAIVLALFVFLLGTPAALAAPPPSLVQQASALLAGQALCGHGQAPVACHAPGACCRPDQALPPPRAAEIAPPDTGFMTVAYLPYREAPRIAGAIPAFRSRAPPV
jgi:hypothetical protein